jgi:hypothetical protein
MTQTMKIGIGITDVGSPSTLSEYIEENLYVPEWTKATSFPENITVVPDLKGFEGMRLDYSADTNTDYAYYQTDIGFEDGVEYAIFFYCRLNDVIGEPTIVNTTSGGDLRFLVSNVSDLTYEVVNDLGDNVYEVKISFVGQGASGTNQGPLQYGGNYNFNSTSVDISNIRLYKKR